MNTYLNDQAARDSALDISQSWIVQAPAGSGKTELLTQRILKLIAVCEQPESILAITFTKKAASEMRSRILSILKMVNDLKNKYSDSDLHNLLNQKEPHEQTTVQLALAALAQDRNQNWNLLDNPNRLQLKTIDSFCSSVVFQLPLLAELGGKSAITEKSEPIYRHACQEFLASLEQNKPWTPALSRVLRYLDKRSEQLENVFVSMLARRLQWISLVVQFRESINDDSHSELKTHMESALSNILEQQFNELRSSSGFSLLYQLDGLMAFCSHKAPESSPIRSLQDIPSIQGLSHHDISYWKAISKLLLTEKNDWRSRIDKNIGFPADKDNQSLEMKSKFKDLLSELSDYSELKDNLVSFAKLPSPIIPDNQLRITADICECLIILLAYLKISFQKHNAVDFNELQLKACHALNPEFDLENDTEANIDSELTSYKPALLALDSRIQHILIDEYQDTSNSQLELIENLVNQWQFQDDGKTLFLVGDPMQSIYRFREANVGIFINAQAQGVQNIPLNAISLSTNFRSEANIVNWVNTTFSNAFPEHNNYRTGAIAYSPSQAFKSDMTFENKNVEYFIHEVELESDTEENPETNNSSFVAARTLCGKIKAIKSKNSNESIAILVRSKSHAKDIITCLKEMQIAYQGIDMDPLLNCPHIINLINLSSSLLHLGDQISWYGLLRSSLLGIENKDLLTLSQKINNTMPLGLYLNTNVSDDSLDISKNQFSSLSNEAQKILERCLPVLKASKEDLKLKPFSFVIQSCWLALGGPASLESFQIADCENFFQLLINIEEQEDILTRTHLFDACSQLFAEPVNNNNNPVLIMSIHKSKGLEFDHVFLPCLDKGTRSDDKKILNWDIYINDKNKKHLLLAPLLPSHLQEDSTLLYDFLEQQEKQKASNENIRLFYVAATRAKKNLYLFGSIKQKLNKKTSELSLSDPAANSLLSLIWQYIDKTAINFYKSSHEQFTTLEKKDEILKSKTQADNYQLKRISHKWENLKLFDLNDSQNASSLNNIEDNTIHSILEQPSKSAALGILIHSCLKQFTEANEKIKQDNWLLLNDYSIYHRTWKSLINNEGIFDSDDVDYIIMQCEICLKICFKDKENSWIFDNALEQSQCEVSVFYKNSLSASKLDFKNYIIDRSFVKNGVRWIIDYKSSAPNEGQNLQDFLNKAKITYKQQLVNYASCYQVLEDRPQQLALYFPKVSRLLKV
jgi:ATP-dependent exoDNAse (exonuclease V) beta subunit